MQQEHQQLEQRIFEFVVRVVNFAATLPQHRVGDVVARQVLRSATSIGANFNEAQGASSKREFAHRISISESEARETHYWLRLSVALDLVTQERLDALLQENHELIAILTSIGRRTRRQEDD